MLFSLYYNSKLKNLKNLKNKANTQPENFNKNQINQNLLPNSLLISSSYLTSHLLPVISNKLQIEKTRRISIGGFHQNEILTKSLHLKYPDLKQKLNANVIQEIQENFSFCALDYKKQIFFLQKIFDAEIKKISEKEKISNFGGRKIYEKIFSEEIKKEQNKNFPFLKTYKNSVEEKNEKFLKENLEISENFPKEKFEEKSKNLIFFNFPKKEENVSKLSEEEIQKKMEQKKEQIEKLKNSIKKKTGRKTKNFTRGIFRN